MDIVHRETMLWLTHEVTRPWDYNSFKVNAWWRDESSLSMQWPAVLALTRPTDCLLVNSVQMARISRTTDEHFVSSAALGFLLLQLEPPDFKTASLKVCLARKCEKLAIFIWSPIYGLMCWVLIDDKVDNLIVMCTQDNIMTWMRGRHSFGVKGLTSTRVKLQCFGSVSCSSGEKFWRKWEEEFFKKNLISSNKSMNNQPNESSYDCCLFRTLSSRSILQSRRGALRCMSTWQLSTNGWPKLLHRLSRRHTDWWRRRGIEYWMQRFFPNFLKWNDNFEQYDKLRALIRLLVFKLWVLKRDVMFYRLYPRVHGFYFEITET